jgi:hypothetical protein
MKTPFYQAFRVYTKNSWMVNIEIILYVYLEKGLYNIHTVVADILALGILV